MATRTITTSERSGHLAEGVYLYAKRMNAVIGSTAYVGADVAWEEWAIKWPEMKHYAEKIQYDIFNAAQRF